MSKTVLMTATALAIGLTAGSADSLAAQEYQGFRYVDGKCQNDAGEEGMNPGYKGECGDLQGEDLQELPLNGIDFARTVRTSPRA